MTLASEHKQFVALYEAYLVEYETLTAPKGKKAAAARARKNLGEMKKLITPLKKSIQVHKEKM